MLCDYFLQKFAAIFLIFARLKKNSKKGLKSLAFFKNYVYNHSTIEKGI